MIQTSKNENQSGVSCLDAIHPQRKPPKVLVEELQTPEWDEDEWIVSTGKRVRDIVEGKRSGCFYLNPLFTVSVSCFSPEFSRKARKCQAAWYRRVDQCLLRKRRKRLERKLDFWRRQAAYTGFLIIDGKCVPPHDWKVLENQHQ